MIELMALDYINIQMVQIILDIGSMIPKKDMVKIDL
jgi:hypothetical protein